MGYPPILPGILRRNPGGAGHSRAASTRPDTGDSIVIDNGNASTSKALVWKGDRWEKTGDNMTQGNGGGWPESRYAAPKKYPNRQEWATILLEDDKTFLPATHAAMSDFVASKPYRGGRVRRMAKFQACADALALAYEINPPTVWAYHSADDSHYSRTTNTIYLTPNMSVFTFLVHFAKITGKTERQALSWSLNLFRRYLPSVLTEVIEKHPLMSPPFGGI
jgi:hypothetical protein